MRKLFVAKMEPSVATGDRNQPFRYYILGTFPAEVWFQLGTLPWENPMYWAPWNFPGFGRSRSTMSELHEWSLNNQHPKRLPCFKHHLAWQKRDGPTPGADGGPFWSPFWKLPNQKKGQVFWVQDRCIPEIFPMLKITTVPVYPMIWDTGIFALQFWVPSSAIETPRRVGCNLPGSLCWECNLWSNQVQWKSTRSCACTPQCTKPADFFLDISPKNEVSLQNWRSLTRFHPGAIFWYTYIEYTR